MDVSNEKSAQELLLVSFVWSPRGEGDRTSMKFYIDMAKISYIGKWFPGPARLPCACFGQATRYPLKIKRVKSQSVKRYFNPLHLAPHTRAQALCHHRYCCWQSLFYRMYRQTLETITLLTIHNPYPNLPASPICTVQQSGHTLETNPTTPLQPSHWPPMVN